MNWVTYDDGLGAPSENVRCQDCIRRCLIPGCPCDDAIYFRCSSCANTGREPVPFTEVWGL